MTQCPGCGTETNGAIYCSWTCFQEDEHAEEHVIEAIREGSS